MDKINSYRKMLLEAKSESAFQKVSNLYSDDILEYKTFPDEYLAFLIEILTKPQFYTKQGVFRFLAIIGIETDIMSTAQLKNISDAIIDSYVNYADGMLCLTACDFIARYYPHEEAERILLRLKYMENEKEEKGFADDGLRILRNERQKTDVTKERD